MFDAQEDSNVGNDNVAWLMEKSLCPGRLREQSLLVTKIEKVSINRQKSNSSVFPPEEEEPVTPGKSGFADNWTVMLVSAAGVLCLVAGAYGLVDSAWFGLRSRRADATPVDIKQADEGPVYTLEYEVQGQRYRQQARGAFGVLWSGGVGKEPVPVLYSPDDPNNARMARFGPGYVLPLILLVLGGVFTPIGYFLTVGENAPRVGNLIYIGFLVAAAVTGAVFALLPLFL